jgi:excisionase family DNA binding protein
MKVAASPVPGFPRIFTVAVVANILQVSTPTIYSLIKSGDLGSISFSTRGGRGVVRVQEDDLRAFIEKSRGGAR